MRPVFGDTVYFLALLNPTDQFPLQIRLAELHFNPQLPGPHPHAGLDVRQRRPPIHVRFTLAKQVQIGAV